MDQAWVYSFPPRLTVLLANLPRKELARVASGWIKAEGTYGSVEEVTEFLGKLCGVARRALTEGKLVVVRHAWDG